MARTMLCAALLLLGLASASAFDFSEFPSEVLDFVKDKVSLGLCCEPRDGPVACLPRRRTETPRDRAAQR